MGDSKSAVGNTWPDKLAAFFAGSTGTKLQYTNAAQAGRGIVLAAPIIDATLAPAVVNTDYPTVICNLGVNDFVGMPAQSVIEAAYLTIIDATKAKWPNVKMWLARPWKLGFDAAADLMAGYIANVQAQRSSFVSLGPDERVFIKGADNGASETVDGIHPSALGQDLYATQWKALLGY
jgi:lysophospholipase L1-like esterase